MKVGDLVRFKHFKTEISVVVRVYNRAGFTTIDVRRIDGAKLLHRDPTAFEVINESR